MADDIVILMLILNLESILKHISASTGIVYDTSSTWLVIVKILHTINASSIMLIVVIVII